MIALLFVVAMFCGLVFMAYRYAPEPIRGQFLATVISGFVLRLIWGLFFAREYAFFSHKIKGGDSQLYEYLAELVAESWHITGIRFVTADIFEPVKGVELVVNFYAAINYLCGGPSFFACLSAVAFLACASSIILYRFALTLGSDLRHAIFVLTITVFSPGFVFHTSDLYKDGLNAFCVIAALYTTITLVRRYSIIAAINFLALMWALWHIRQYMVFMCLIPFIVAFVLGRAGTTTQKATLFLTLGVGLLAAIALSGQLSTIMDAASMNLDKSSSDVALRYNADAGSGVYIPGNGPWPRLLRLIYTVFSPFPWQGGSIGFHLGKIDTVLWYYMMFYTWKNRRALFKFYRRQTLTLLSFLVPSFIAYSNSMSNIGLIYRQRMPLVMIASCLFAVAKTFDSRAKRNAQPPLSQLQKSLSYAH